jgi:tRNA A-37 threonylcarbamoyl transferase component Bud32
MNESEKERLLGECLEEYHRRRALGERPRVEEWQERLGEHFEEFREILAAADAIDDLIEPGPRADNLPRPFGEYTLMRLLGRGAMGVVYEAVHRGLGRKVALKILRSGFEDDPLAYERFRREARACAQVRHDHIVTIYEAGQVEGRPFYAMPVLEGSSLLELIRAGEVPPPEELCRGLADVADALQALNEAGIVHRDVKPANIMVEPGGRMILADFGLARTAATQTLTATGQALGTPLYMSPEQLLGRKEEIDGRSDVYGLGVTLYEALAGRPPFKADDVSGLMKMILSERPRPLPNVVPEAPLPCSFIAMKAMEKRKEDRYDTAAAMREDLLAFAEGRRVEGRPVSHLRFTLRKYRWHLTAAAALLLICAVFATWFFTRDATLTVMSFPVAQVRLDGVDHGPTPVEVALAPGLHELALRQEGFGEQKQEIRLSAGEKRMLQTALVASDPEDAEALQRLGQELEVAMRKLGETPRGSVTRGADHGVQAQYPRGDLRIADLDHFRIDVVDDPMGREFVEVDGTIEFRRGEEVLWSTEFEAESTWTLEEIPEAVRSALREGDTVTWGYFPRDGDPVTADFRVVADPLAERLAEIERRLAEQHWVTRSHLRIQLLLDRGLCMGALAEAARIVAENVESEAGWAAVREAVNRMGLAKSLLGQEVRGKLLRRPK